MLLEKDVQKLFHQLVKNDHAQISLEGSNIAIRILEDATKLSLSTPVYYGGNYIPNSVRRSLKEDAPYEDASISTYLTIDESQYQIDLNYLGNIDHFDNEQFRILLEEFAWIASEWKYYLDNNDKKDLIYVPVR
jgi:hypothetical protein